MNGTNRTSLVVGMLVALVGIFSSVVWAEGVENEGIVDSTVVQVAHWQAMNPDSTDATVVQVAHWQAMNPNFTDATAIQVAHWQAMTEITEEHTLAIVDNDAVAEVIAQR